MIGTARFGIWRPPQDFGARYRGDVRRFSAYGLAGAWDTARRDTFAFNGNDVSALASIVPGGIDLSQGTAANQPLGVGTPVYGEFPSIQMTAANNDRLFRANTNLIGTAPATLISAHRFRALAGGAYNGVIGNSNAGQGFDMNASTTGLRDGLFVSNSEHTMGAASTTAAEVWSIAASNAGSVVGLVNGVAQTMSTQAGSWNDAGGTADMTIGKSAMANPTDLDFLFGAIFTTQAPFTVTYRIHKALAPRAGVAA